MRLLFTVFAKEVVDNIRDRRTLASALLMGPLFGPILFGPIALGPFPWSRAAAF